VYVNLQYQAALAQLRSWRDAILNPLHIMPCGYSQSFSVNVNRQYLVAPRPRAKDFLIRILSRE
jgi:hypothetical protein